MFATRLQATTRANPTTGRPVKSSTQPMPLASTASASSIRAGTVMASIQVIRRVFLSIPNAEQQRISGQAPTMDAPSRLTTSSPCMTTTAIATAIRQSSISRRCSVLKAVPPCAAASGMEDVAILCAAPSASNTPNATCRESPNYQVEVASTSTCLAAPPASHASTPTIQAPHATMP